MMIKDQDEVHYFFLVRGLIRSRFHWHTFPQTLSQYLSSHNINHQIILFDIAGNGKRHGETTPMSIEAMADDLLNQVDLAIFNAVKTKHAKARLHLVGISMGGMIFSQLARKLSSLNRPASSLHIINSSFSNVARFWQRMKIPAALSLLCNIRVARKRERCILHWTSNLSSRQQYSRLWIEEAIKHPLTLRNGLAQLVAAFRFKIPAKPAPYSFVYASFHDRLVDFACSKKIASDWQVPLAVELTAGHDLSLDAPQWLAEQIVENTLITLD